MKTKNLSRLRSLIRWTSGTALAAAIIAGACLFFPALSSSVPALVLTSAFAVLIGLEVALPPINPEDDWIPIRGRETRTAAGLASEAPVHQEVVKVARAHVPPRHTVQPIHAARRHSVPLYRILHLGRRHQLARSARGLALTLRRQTRQNDYTRNQTIGYN